MKSNYVKCEKCGIIRNKVEAPKCPVCEHSIKTKHPERKKEYDKEYSKRYREKHYQKKKVDK